MSRKIYTDALMRLAKGTDAGLYRLIPQKVVSVNNEDDVLKTLQECRQQQTPITFKASGTSLSGQAISDSVLMEIGPDFTSHRILDDKGLEATFACGIVGAKANRLLRRYGRKIGPQPASIKSAKIGGIVANNASGASYGIRYNSYHTLKAMRLILADGTLLDTGDPTSRKAFETSHAELLVQLSALHDKVIADQEMHQRIQHKYEIKNTCGYSLNALVDFEDPIDILAHLMIGSEGTLGFISEVTLETVPDYPLKATSLIFFKNLTDACAAIKALRKCNVSAAELMDRNALRAVEDKPGLPAELKTLPESCAALLIDTSSSDEQTLKAQFQQIENELRSLETLYPIHFTTDQEEYTTLWNVRSGLLTSAAATRQKGTISIIEDIAFRSEVLGEALAKIKETLASFGYPNSVMWGHLLDGNVHFILFPDMRTEEGVKQYAAFMQEFSKVVLSFDGSQKAEHGTGRNIAPFVKAEWGEKLYGIMHELKDLIDPMHLLNPGVILNDDPAIFIKHLKETPIANDIIDKCIECGFCEVQCPSRNLTLTPRQRTVVYRKLTAMVEKGEENTPLYKELKKSFNYNAEETCATDGLCAMACPVEINTGLLIKELRWKENSSVANKIASGIAHHMAGTTNSIRPLLHVPHLLAKAISYKGMELITGGLFELSGHRFPLWTRYTPRGAKKLNYLTEKATKGQPEMVYFPSCITRTMGTSADYKEKESVTQVTIQLLHRAGYAIRYPEGIHALCCGMAFSSKGFRKQAAEKQEELNRALLQVSDNGRLPILCDMSPCLLHMRETLDKRLVLKEPVEFIYDHLLERLTFHTLPQTVAIHSTCSTKKMGIAPKMEALAQRCARKVVNPEEITCCAWAGDRGFFYPELNSSALRTLRKRVKEASEGYSNSRTCEIGLTLNSGLSYKSIVYLVERATR